MNHLLLNSMVLQARRAMAWKEDTRYAIVTNYDPSKYAVKVKLLPEGSVTGYIPVASPWVGNGWGVFAPPTPGNLCSIVFFNGDIESGFLTSCFFNDIEQPLSVNSGELWIVHASGQFAKWTNDGKLTFSDGQGATIVLNGDGSITSAATVWNHTGPVNIDGDTSITGTLTVDGNTTINGNTELNGAVSQGIGGSGGAVSLIGPVTSTNDVVGDGVSLANHDHGGVETGSGNTGPPL